MIPSQRVQFLLSTISLSTLMLPVGYAGIPLWTLTPITPTALTLSSTDTIEVDYLLTNQSRHVHRLVMTPINGVQQQTGSGDCQNPVTLSYQQSCRLALVIEGRLLANNINAGPVVCQDGNPLQCYQPEEKDRLLVNGVICNKVITSSLTTTNPYNQPLTIRYLMAGGGGGSGGGPSYSNGAGGGGGSSAILVDGTSVMVASGGNGGNSTISKTTLGASGTRTDNIRVFSLPVNSSLNAFVGGGGGGGGVESAGANSPGGGGGSGYYGGGGGAYNNGGYSGGSGGSDRGGKGGGNAGDGMIERGGTGGNSSIHTSGAGGTGGDGFGGGVGGDGGDGPGGDGGNGHNSANGGGGGFGSGGGGGGSGGDTGIGSSGGNGGSKGSDGNEGGSGNGQGPSSLGALTWQSLTTFALPQDAGMGGQQQGQGGNGGLIIIQYNSPTTTCLL
jgi:hypothetical protein